jgi:hypothetical protein
VPEEWLGVVVGVVVVVGLAGGAVVGGAVVVDVVAEWLGPPGWTDVTDWTGAVPPMSPMLSAPAGVASGTAGSEGAPPGGGGMRSSRSAYLLIWANTGAATSPP